MAPPGNITLFSQNGNPYLESVLEKAGFDVSTVTEVTGIPSGTVILDLVSPEQAGKFLFGGFNLPQELRARGYTVLAVVSSETFADERTAQSLASAHSYLLENDSPQSIRASVLAATRRKELDDALRKSEERYRLLAEHSGDVIWTWDIRTRRFDYISPSIKGLRGFSVEEALVEPLEQSLTPESLQKVLARIEAGMEALGRGVHPIPFTDYYDQPCKDGSLKTVEITTSIIYDEAGAPTQVLGVSRDATERVRDKKSLEAALRQRELLHKELAHRVKNTLAMAGSLLSLAAAHVRDPVDATLFEESRGRLDALSLVYDKLLRSADVSRIDLGAYLEDLCRTITCGFSTDAGRVDLAVERKAVGVDSRRAALMGLLVNELVMNSMKYAVRPDRPLKLLLEIQVSGGDSVLIRFQDDGPGLAAGFDTEKSTGLGFQLIHSLVSQLNGTIAVDSSDAGVAFRLSIPLTEGDGIPVAAS